MTRRPDSAAGAPAGTRERMVAGAADLLRRRGVAATSLRGVVKHTGTPRGSLAHHFPGGKAQLLEEAVVYARRHVSGPLQQALERLGPVRGLRAFTAQWRGMLETTSFEAGCPVMAVAIEQATDARISTRQQVLELARGAFDEWAALVAAALRREGLPPARARSLAVLVIASFEGAIGLCRAARSTRPLDEVSLELEAIIDAALTARRRSPQRGPAG